VGSELTRIHAFFTGRVQGVFFRASTQKKAQELGLNGWVRNLSDGRVEAVFQGSSELIDALITWCKDSMPLSHVISVETEQQVPENIQGFEIIR